VSNNGASSSLGPWRRFIGLEHYNRYAEEFWQGTRDHDVSQNIAALLQYIRNEPPFKILDFGCGPGRDLKTFTELGHIAIGLERASSARSKVYDV
jgi:SAM-dependent methyltransferase